MKSPHFEVTSYLIIKKLRLYTNGVYNLFYENGKIIGVVHATNHLRFSLD